MPASLLEWSIEASSAFRGESAFSTWLHRLTINVVYVHLRKKVLPVVSLDETLPTEEGGTEKDYGSQDQILVGSIDLVNLERAIETLPPGSCIIFVLRDIEGYEHNEIAEMLGCSIGNSKAQLHKARMKLRDQLNVTRAENGRRKAPQTERAVTMATGRGSRAAATAA
jgi:RNA polymerase sigma-70 factor, ECF subfamily